NLVIPRVVDDCPYPQSSAKNQSNPFLIQALTGQQNHQLAIYASLPETAGHQQTRCCPNAPNCRIRTKWHSGAK
ncbi:hypothetical protein, partial [Acetobacter lambici]